MNGVVQSFGEVGDRGKNQFQEAIMCFGSVKMERFVQIWEAEDWGRKKNACSLRNCLWMEGKQKVQEQLGRENVLGQNIQGPMS